jgi:hypothetical protein
LKRQKSKPKRKGKVLAVVAESEVKQMLFNDALLILDGLRPIIAEQEATLKRKESKKLRKEYDKNYEIFLQLTAAVCTENISGQTH